MLETTDTPRQAGGERKTILAACRAAVWQMDLERAWKRAGQWAGCQCGKHSQ